MLHKLLPIEYRECDLDEVCQTYKDVIFTKAWHTYKAGQFVRMLSFYAQTATVFVHQDDKEMEEIRVVLEPHHS